MNRVSGLLLIVLVIMLVTVVESRADVEVRRYGEENPMITIAKSTFWGGVAGLVLGGAVALVAGENEDDIVKWFFVGGVFTGFGVGLYHVATRPKPTSSLLEINGDGLAVNLPSIRFAPEDVSGHGEWRAAVTVFSLDF